MEAATDLRAMLEDTVERLFSEQVTKEEIEAAERGEWLADLWRSIEENGLLRPHLREAAGGAGGSWLEALVILKAAGRHAVPLPVAETVIGGWLLDRAGIAIPEGPLTLLPEPVANAKALTAAAGNVPWGRDCRHAVFVTEGAAPRVGLVATGGAREVRRGDNIAREPRDTLVFERAPILALAAARLPREVVRLYGALARSAQMAGALESLLEQAVRYAGERVQFGRPIGKFQAIQHELAKLAGETAASGVAAEAAFRAAARAETADFDPRFEIAVAKIRIGGAVDRSTSIAHQVHGAIGFTYEHGLHFSTRRLWAWRAEHGSDTAWAEWLGKTVIGRGADRLWPDLVARGLHAHEGGENSR